jgi:hypothetical protein
MKPYGFFDIDPTLDVPKQNHCHTSCES